MKKLIALVCLSATICLATGTAMADNVNLKGRYGVFGRIGFLSVSDSELLDARIKPDVGFIGGGGLFYGVTDRIVAEVEVTRSEYGSDFPVSGSAGNWGITNVSVTAHYRFEVGHKQLVPYAGGGLDFLLNEYDRGDVQNSVGIHATGGVDYFLTKDLALNAEVRGLLAPEADIKVAGAKLGNFDPSSFSTLFGVRYFFK